MIETAGMLAAVVAASVLGSLHCAGMCGGLVLFAVGSDGHLRKRAGLHAAYHGTRGVSYTLLGLAAGAIGAAADVSAALAGDLSLAALLAGGAMIVVGGIALAQNIGLAVPRARLPRPLRRVTEAAHRGAFALPPLHRAAAIGGLTPLLPCGWLYMFVVLAAGTGHPATGALVMAAFWLGTLPLMGALGVGAQVITGPIRRRLPALTPLIAISLGLLTVINRATVASVAVPEIPRAAGAGADEASRQLAAVRAAARSGVPHCGPGVAARPGLPRDGERETPDRGPGAGR